MYGRTPVSETHRDMLSVMEVIVSRPDFEDGVATFIFLSRSSFT
jgi:hypothetical protein